MWQVHDDQASLEFEGLAARVSLVDPSQGVFEIRLGGSELPGARLLRPRQFARSREQQAPDWYVRGPDLVATYPHNDQKGMHCQLDWRLIHHPDLSVVGLEMVVSLRTDLLDDDATLHVASEIPSAEMFCLLDDPPGSFLTVPSTGRQVISATETPSRLGLLLHRMVNELGSYIEIAHPTDFTTVRIERASEETPLAKTTFPLFAERLEKGVIRRARAQALFTPSANDQTTAVECYQRFANSPPPLTV